MRMMSYEPRRIPLHLLILSLFLWLPVLAGADSLSNLARPDEGEVLHTQNKNVLDAGKPS